jgi:hypothetical protein
MDELLIFQNPTDEHPLAVLYAAHYNEFAKAVQLLVGSDAAGDAIRQAGDRLGPEGIAGLPYGTWYFQLTLAKEPAGV